MTSIHIANSGATLRIYTPLAEEIGLNPSLILLQIEFWLNQEIKEKVVIDGVQWLGLSLNEMRKRAFTFWSRQTINSNIEKLRDMGLISLATQTDLVLPEKIAKKFHDDVHFIRLNSAGLQNLESVVITTKDDDLSRNLTTPVKKLDSKQAKPSRNLTHRDSFKRDSLDNDSVATDEATDSGFEKLPDYEARSWLYDSEPIADNRYAELNKTDRNTAIFSAICWHITQSVTRPEGVGTRSRKAFEGAVLKTIVGNPKSPGAYPDITPTQIRDCFSTYRRYCATGSSLMDIAKMITYIGGYLERGETYFVEMFNKKAPLNFVTIKRDAPAWKPDNHPIIDNNTISILQQKGHWNWKHTFMMKFAKLEAWETLQLGDGITALVGELYAENPNSQDFLPFKQLIEKELYHDIAT